MSTLVARPRTRLVAVIDAAEPGPGEFHPAEQGSLTDEQHLVERARADIDAFAELYRMYLPRIHNFAFRRTGSVEAAEDICSATFEAALRGIGDFEWKAGGLAPWLFRIASNQTVAHHRRQGRVRSKRGQAAMARLHDPSTDGDVGDLLPDDVGELRVALDRLHARYQRAVSLRYLSGLDQADAARAMGLSRPAFAVVLSRALKALRRELTRGGDQA